MALQTAQRALEGAAARRQEESNCGCKKASGRSAKESRKLRGSSGTLLPKVPSCRDGAALYLYRGRVNHLKATVELGFVIQDTSEAVIVPTVPILETQEKPFTVLENVKPDDTMGVRAEGEVPSETQFLEKSKMRPAIDCSLKPRKRSIGLPPLILQSADRKAAKRITMEPQSYICFTSTPLRARAHPERKRAQKFLQDNYNFRAYGEPPKS